MPSTDCGLQPGDRIWSPNAEDLTDCIIPEGVVFSIPYDDERPVMDVEDRPMEPAPGPSPEPEPAPTPVMTTESVPTDTPDTPDIAKLAEVGGDNTILLAIIAVVGGGAGFKLWQSMAAQHHERAMKRLDIDAQHKGMGAGQPPPCKAANEAIEARLASLEARTSANERASARLVAALDADEVDDLKKRLELLERKNRAAT